MCYKPMRPKAHIDYACPSCQAHTQYSRRERKPYRTVKRVLAVCRTVAEQVEGLRFDEAELCRKCRPGVKEPRVWLELSYGKGEPTHRVEVTQPDDCKLVLELLQDANSHKGNRDRTTPLKDHLERLRALFGTGAQAPPSPPAK